MLLISKISWLFNSNGLFSFRIWAADIPSKLQFFGWLIAHGRVNTCYLVQMTAHISVYHQIGASLCKEKNGKFKPSSAKLSILVTSCGVKYLRNLVYQWLFQGEGLILYNGIHYVGYGLGNIVGKKRTNLLEENMGTGMGFGES